MPILNTLSPNDPTGEERTADDDNQYSTIENASNPVYDAKGNLTEYDDPDDEKWKYKYDWANRLTKVEFYPGPPLGTPRLSSLTMG